MKDCMLALRSPTHEEMEEVWGLCASTAVLVSVEWRMKRAQRDGMVENVDVVDRQRVIQSEVEDEFSSVKGR